jgi:hypothetical protein
MLYSVSVIPILYSVSAIHKLYSLSVVHMLYNKLEEESSYIDAKVNKVHK